MVNVAVAGSMPDEGCTSGQLPVDSSDHGTGVSSSAVSRTGTVRRGCVPDSTPMEMGSTQIDGQ